MLCIIAVCWHLAFAAGEGDVASALAGLRIAGEVPAPAVPELPSAILSNILKLLSQQDRLTAAPTCREAHAVVQSLALTDPVSFGLEDPDEMVAMHVSAAICQDAAALTRLMQSISKNSTNQSVLVFPPVACAPIVIPGNIRALKLIGTEREGVRTSFPSIDVQNPDASVHAVPSSRYRVSLDGVTIFEKFYVDGGSVLVKNCVIADGSPPVQHVEKGLRLVYGVDIDNARVWFQDSSIRHLVGVHGELKDIALRNTRVQGEGMFGLDVKKGSPYERGFYSGRSQGGDMDNFYRVYGRDALLIALFKGARADIFSGQTEGLPRFVGMRHEDVSPGGPRPSLRVFFLPDSYPMLRSVRDW